MVLHGYPQTSAKLANGESVFRNDHIYVSPPWSDRDGTPYMIARIIEFLPPNATPRKGRQVQSTEVQVRISLYYRPSDISGRNVSDFRLLLAAIHTDVQPLSHIRGKCYVRHKDRIEDLLAWKKMPDRFYFVRFFDPYIKREYEVIRTETVNNIPQKVKETLMNRYEYLVMEREMVSDLTDNYRSCCVCTQWASSQDSIRCESCKNIYHMHCVNPPLLNKPAKGYSWFCIPCSLQRHKDVQDKKFHFSGSAAVGGKAGKGGSGAGGSGTDKKEKNKSATGTRPDVTFRGWPWRYFGQYTVAEDTLDPDYPIFPRAATRVGPKFQANVPSWEEQTEAQEAVHRSFGESNDATTSRHIAVERGHDIGERKNESTIDVLCRPSDALEPYMSEVAALRLAVPPYDTERLNTAIISYTNLGRQRALLHISSLKYEDFKPIIFSDKETSIFAAELETAGGLDTHAIGKRLRRTPGEVLRFSYIWENKQLKSENDALKAHTKVLAHARKGQTQSQTLGAPSLGKIRAREDGEDSDGEGSTFNEEQAVGAKLQCAACSTRNSRVWWRCPRSIQGNAMCENCGTNYRKYGVISFVKADDSKKTDKKDVLNLSKRGKGDASGTATPVPTPPPKLPPCVCCRRMEPKSTMARCKNCTFSAHASCYGIAPQDMGPDWECELCLNVKLEDNHLEPRCVLCPRDTSLMTTKVKSKKPPADFDYLSALKPTEGRRWAHILCSAWIPEIIYTKPSTLKAVEGIANLPLERWTTVCSLCNQLDGAIIHCTDCEVAFHPSCAYQSGYKFGFEFSLAKPGKREVVTISKFKDGTGVMNPGCWCKAHDLEGRTIYDSHEVDPEQNETALQVYAAAYKSLPPHDDTFALLRKARRLDHVLLVPTPKAVNDRPCAVCTVDVSPLWHDIGSDLAQNEDRMEIDGEEPPMRSSVGQGTGGRMCHLCWFKSRRTD